MAKTNTPVFTQGYRVQNTTFTDADTTNYKTLITAGADDTRVYKINASTDSATNVNITLNMNDGSTSIPIATYVLTALRGSDAASAPLELVSDSVSVLRGIDRNNNAYIALPTGSSLELKMDTTLPATNSAWVVTSAEDY